MVNRDRDVRHQKACVIGAGPNGLAAAIVLAQAGLRVDLFEAEAQPGGGARTMELTLPGFHHDFGSAVHPMAVGSPFFNSLPLADYGLEWIYSPAPLAHPFDDGTAVTLERNLEGCGKRALGDDGRAWRNLMAPLAKNWPAFAKDVLRPLLRFPSHPFLLANFAQDALAPATFVARRRFRNERTRALFAGLAAHSFLSLSQPLSASFGMVLGAAAHAVGWPIPRGGAQAITNALSAHLVRPGRENHSLESRGKTRSGSQIRCRPVRHHAAAVVALIAGKAIAGISQEHGGVPLRPGSFQGGLRAFIADSMEVGRLFARRDRPSGRKYGGDCRI